MAGWRCAGASAVCCQRAVRALATGSAAAPEGANSATGRSRPGLHHDALSRQCVHRRPLFFARLLYCSVGRCALSTSSTALRLRVGAFIRLVRTSCASGVVCRLTRTIVRCGVVQGGHFFLDCDVLVPYVCRRLGVLPRIWPVSSLSPARRVASPASPSARPLVRPALGSVVIPCACACAG